MAEVTNGNPLDQNKSGKVRVKKTKFPIHIHDYKTYRFGEYGVLGAFNGITDDSVKMRQILDVNTYTLKAPLLTPITMNRVYTQVPKMAVLPNAWPLIDVNPSFGDDIDAEEYGTSVKAEYFQNFLRKTAYHLYNSVSNIVNTTTFNSVANAITMIQDLIEAMVLNELVYSNGSLINNLRAHIARFWPSTKGRSFDWMFEYIWQTIKANFGGIKYQKANGQVYTLKLTPNSTVTNEDWATNEIFETENEFFTELRDGNRLVITALVSPVPGIHTDSTISTPMTAIKTKLNDKISTGISINKILVYKPFDTIRLWSYQLSCAEFFTNDKVDYIYNADTYRNYIGTLFKDTAITYGEITTTGLLDYDWNGQKIQTDWLSAKIFTYMTNKLQPTGNNITPNSVIDNVWAYVFALFKFNRSLKYKDYLTGSRTRPIAIGNTDIQVQANNTVEVIDIVKNIQKQRFLNVVNKIPRDLKGYSKGIMGKDIAPDWHNPLFLVKISESVYGQETENTGEAQLTQPQTRTSVLKNQGNRIEVRFSLDRASIVIGFVYFDIPRAYSKGIDREYFEKDRYDFFNPYMQYTGDQEVFRQELDAIQNGTFAYQGAYMEKKQKINDACGGFIETLNGWTFLDQYIETDSRNDISKNQGPEFIRSKPSELDRFYISLTGTVMAYYYHFIVDVETHYEAVRPMSYDPQIL